MADADVLLSRLDEAGELRLASFTSEELVAVGADSPLQGLTISDRLAAMGPVPLTAALAAALRGLVARGFVHPELATSAEPQLEEVLDRLSDAGSAAEDLTVPLSGDLAVVVALRRAPALVCLVSEPSRGELEQRGPLAHRRTDAILHGFAADDGADLAGFLEERRSSLGIHDFVLRTVQGECAALCSCLEGRARESLDGDGRCEDAIEVAVPGHDRESTRLLVSLEAAGGDGAARISWPAAPGAPVSEAMALGHLADRLAELLGRLWRDGDGAVRARVTAC